MLRSRQRISLTALVLVGLVLLSAGAADAAVQREVERPTSGWEQPLLKLQQVWAEVTAWWSGDASSAVAKEGAGLSNGG